MLELSVEGQRVALSLQVLSGRGAANVSPGPVALQVHPWPSRHICARSAPTPAHWGQYCQRGEALGIPIMVSKLHLQLLQPPTAATLKGTAAVEGVALVQPCSLLRPAGRASMLGAAVSAPLLMGQPPPPLVALQAFQCVSKEAVAATVHTLHCMLQHTPPQILQRLRESDADVGIIGRHQVPNDGVTGIQLSCMVACSLTSKSLSGAPWTLCRSHQTCHPINI